MHPRDIEDYLILVERIKEAWEEEKRSQRHLRLARKAVIAEIRDKHGQVNSIAPEEIRRLIEAYLKDHPEENVIKSFACY